MMQVNVRHHLLEIRNVLTEEEQRALAGQLRADLDFHRALVRRFERDLRVYSDKNSSSGSGSGSSSSRSSSSRSV